MKRNSEQKKKFFACHNIWNLLATTSCVSFWIKGSLFLCPGFYETLLIYLMHVTVCKSEERLLGFFIVITVFSGQYQHYISYAGIRYFGVYCHARCSSLHCFSDWMCVIRKKRKRITEAFSNDLYPTQVQVELTHILYISWHLSLLYLIFISLKSYSLILNYIDRKNVIF